MNLMLTASCKDVDDCYEFWLQTKGERASFTDISKEIFGRLGSQKFFVLYVDIHDRRYKDWLSQAHVLNMCEEYDVRPTCVWFEPV